MEGNEIQTVPIKPIESSKKTASNVEMWDFLRNVEIPVIPLYDGIIVYGQGPVQDKSTKKKAETVTTFDEQIQEEINTFGRTSAVAVGYLRTKNQFRECFFSGGKTGGVDRNGKPFKSEAALMDQGTRVVFGDPHDSNPVHLEDESTNTLQNFAKTLNKMDGLTKDDRTFDRLLMLGSYFHVPRIRDLAVLFNIKNIDVLGSEEVIKVMMHDPSVPQDVIDRAADYLIPDRDKKLSARKTVLDWIDQRTDPRRIALNRTGTGDYRSYIGGGENISQRAKPYTYYEKQKAKYPRGEESKDPLGERASNEDKFSTALIMIPENWVGYLSEINNPMRLRDALVNVTRLKPGFLDRIGLSDSSIDSLKSIDTNTAEGIQVLQSALTVIRDKLRPLTINKKDGGERITVELDWTKWPGDPNISTHIEDYVVKDKDGKSVLDIGKIGQTMEEFNTAVRNSINRQTTV